MWRHCAMRPWPCSSAVSVPPSGRVSTEHVINVLGRLQAQPLPETVATVLQVSKSPLANTARYDSLRAGSDVQEADHA